MSLHHKIAVWLALLLLAAPAPAPAPAQHPAEPPLTGRPADYSHVVGQYDIQVTATPTEVPVEQPILLRVVISGVGPAKYEPKRELLCLFPLPADKDFPSWDKDFYVEELREQHRIDRDARTWTFFYRLKPKHTGIVAIDGIRLRYYDPQSRSKSGYIPRFADAIPIVVKPAAENDEPDVADLAAPESFYEYTAIDDGRAPAITEFSPPPLLPLLYFLAAVPVLCFVAAYFWKRSCPGEAERRRQEQSRAAELALAQLRAAKTPVWQILDDYLRNRFALALQEPMPGETAARLLRRGFAKALCGQCRSVLQACDAQRYGHLPAQGSASLNEDAMRLIAALEADPCAH